MPSIKKKSHKSAFLLIVAFFVSITIILLLFNPNIPIAGFVPFDKNKLMVKNTVLCITDLDGKSINAGFYGKNSPYCYLSALSKHTCDAFIAVEDKRFYSHSGIDFLRVLSAIKNNLTCGKAKEGASTITQQLVKNTHLSGEKTIKRKINEVRIAKEIERNYSKSEILEKYLNVLYFGNNVYGLQAAANVYFSKNASELTLSESALLAGIINSPAKYNPFVYPQNAIARRNLVLSRMLKQNLIDNDEYQNAINCSVNFSKEHKNNEVFVKKAIAEAKNSLNIARGNFTILTNLDSGLSAKCEKIMGKYAVRDAFTEIIVAENATGACIANVSNAQYDISALRRMPGSTIKPFIAYAPAIEKRLVYTITPILDEKTNFSGYSPENFDKKYHGWVSVENALACSYNIPAVKLLNYNGIKYSQKIAEKFGLKFDSSDNSLALALGAMSHGVTLGSLTESFMTLARGGSHVNLHYVSAVLSENDKPIFSQQNCLNQAVGEDTAFLLTDMLMKSVSDGTAKRLKNITNAEIAAKTGTVGNTEGNSDAYCIAFTPKYTISVRISSNGKKLLPNEISGGTVPCSIVGEIIRILGDSGKFIVPSSVTQVALDRKTLSEKQMIVPANALASERDKITAYFSKRNMPLIEDNWFDTELDYFEDFHLGYGFFD